MPSHPWFIYSVSAVSNYRGVAERSEKIIGHAISTHQQTWSDYWFLSIHNFKHFSKMLFISLKIKLFKWESNYKVHLKITQKWIFCYNLITSMSRASYASWKNVKQMQYWFTVANKVKSNNADHICTQGTFEKNKTFFT